MFEASMHPVVLGWEFEYLGLEKRIHATCIIRVAVRWEIAERRKDGHPIPFEIRQYFRDERHNARAPHSCKSRDRSQSARRDAEKRHKNRIFDAMVHVRSKHDRLALPKEFHDLFGACRAFDHLGAESAALPFGEVAKTRVRHVCVQGSGRHFQRVKDAPDFDAHEMKPQKDGRRSIPVFEINRAFNLDEISYPLRATEPLNASFEIAADDMPEVVPRKLIVLTYRLFRKAEAQVDKDYMFAAAGKRIQRRAERAAEPRDQWVWKY